MRTRSERGEPFSPIRLLEALESRFGAFEAIAYASLKLARKKPEEGTSMDGMTADAVLEFGEDLRQAYQAAVEWRDERRITSPSAERMAERTHMRLEGA